MSGVQRKFVKRVVAKPGAFVGRKEEAKPRAKNNKVLSKSSAVALADDLLCNYSAGSLVLKADAPLLDYGISEMPDLSYEPPLKEIVGIQFTDLTSTEIRSMSVVKVCSTKMSGENSIYDPRMGTITNYKHCVICKKDWKECVGHPGHIELPVTLPHPIRMKRIAEYLSCFCEFCRRPVISRKQARITGTNGKDSTIPITRYRGENRFKAFLDVAKKTVRCKYCKKPHGKYTVEDDKFHKHYKKKAQNKASKIPISYAEVADILLNIREVDVRFLFSMPKENPVSEARLGPLPLPEHLLIRNLCVLPPTARPFVESNNTQCHDDLSHKYIEIVKIVDKLNTKGLQEKKTLDLVDSLMFHVKTFMDNGKNKARDPAGKRPLKAIKQRFVGKGGIIRQNIQGKRGGQCGRSVISPDPTLHANEVGVPREVANKITYMVWVNAINLKKCQELLENGRVVYIIRGNTRIDARFALYTRGFRLNHGDTVVRNGCKINPSNYSTGIKNFILRQGDQVIRQELVETEDGVYQIKKKLIKNVEPPKRKAFSLKIGDKIERKLQDGDWGIFNRQPTLHESSMRAKKVRIHDFKTFRMNLACTTAFNADFDGDEMNFSVPSDDMSKAELISVMSTEAQYIDAADSKPMLSIKQDAMSGGYIFTLGRLPVSRATFMDTCCTADWGDMKELEKTEYVCKKMNQIREVHRWLGMEKEEMSRLEAEIRKKEMEQVQELKKCKIELTTSILKGISTLALSKRYSSIRAEIRALRERLVNLQREASDSLLYTGHGLISMLFPSAFEYKCDNKMSPDKKPVKIVRGVLIQGTLNKAALGSSSGSLIHHLYKDFGPSVGCDFVTNYQRFMNVLLERRGFSVGIGDCTPKSTDVIQSELRKCFLQAKAVMETEQDLEVRENKIIGLLNEATNVGEKIAKDSLDPNNNFITMIVSGAKGSMFNIVHSTSAIGQQNIEGRRIPKNYGGRTLPCYIGTPGSQHAPDNIPEPDEFMDEAEAMAELFESRGFISSSFFSGLSPQEFFFLSAGGREGLIDTSVKTAKCGYLSRRLIKMMEDHRISYDGITVVNSRGSQIGRYGEDGLAATELIKTEKFGMQMADVSHICDVLNSEFEWNRYLSEKPTDASYSSGAIEFQYKD